MAVRTVGVRVGDLTQTSAKAVLVCLTNTATTFVVNGVSYAVTWNQIGTDYSPTYAEAGYYATVAITGLSAFTEYSWTVTHGGAWSNTGAFRTAARETDDFTLFFATCHLPNNTDIDSPGALNYIRTYQQTGALPVQAILWHDDLFYTESRSGVTGGGKALSGSSPAAGTPLKEFDYALAWFAYFGLMDSYELRGGGDFQAALENSAMMPQWGDHEFANDIRPANATYSTIPNAYHATASPGFDGVGLTAWNKLLKPLQGAAIPGATDTQANHWAVDFGILRYVAVDGLTRNNGTGGGGGGPDESGAGATLGTNQSADVLNALNVANPIFKIIGMLNELRNVADTGTAGWANKEAERLKTTEYQSLYTVASSTPKSISANRFTNGQDGVAIVCKGDNHSGGWGYFQAPAAGAQAAEKFFVCQANNSRGGLMVATDTSKQGTVIDNVKLHWVSRLNAHAAVIQIDVYGRARKMRVKLIWNDIGGTTGSQNPPYTWTVPVERWFYPHNTNEGKATKGELVLMPGIMAGRKQA